MPINESLPDELGEKVWEACSEMRTTFESGNAQQALSLADQQWALLPGDDDAAKTHWVEAMDISDVAATGAAKAGLKSVAQKWLDRYIAACHGVEGPDLLFKEGAIRYFMGDLDQAQPILKRALKLAGPRMFRGHDPNLLALAKGKPLTNTPPQTTPTPATYNETEGDKLAEAGNHAMEQGNWKKAAQLWTQGLDLIPEPKEDYDAAGWFWGSIADANWFGNHYQDCIDNAELALGVQNMRDNPFIWLRLGQAQTQLGHTNQAIESLTSAFMLGGHEIFDGENPEYLNLLRTHGIRGV